MKRKELIVFIGVLVSLCLFVSVSALLYQTIIQSDFDEGIYNNTYYNTTNNAVQLNLSYNNGTYMSQVFNPGSIVSLNNLSWEYQRIQCPEGMAYINKLNGFCIDKYEAVAMNSDGTWNESSDDNGWREVNTVSLLNAGGYAGSEAGHYPWVYVSANQARTACSNAGKYLCTDEQWLASANYQGEYYNLAKTLSACTVSSNCILGNNLGPNGGDACYGGAMVNCYSSEGVYDMTGNVWEWTNETVDVTNPDGVVGWKYPNSTQGWQTTTGTATAMYGDDAIYFPTTTTKKAVARGGAWFHGAKAGPFYADLDYAPTAAYQFIGFRCCSS